MNAQAAGPALYEAAIGRYSRRLSLPFMSFAGVGDGMRALDVGCGTGSLTRALAERAGADRISAVDPCHPFVEECRRQVNGADIRVGVAEELPFPDSTFDVVLCQLALNFVADMRAAVAEMHRVARPHGVLAACVWTHPDGLELRNTVVECAVSLGLPGAAVLAVYRPRLSTAAQLRRLWREAEIADVVETEIRFCAPYADFQECWTSLDRSPSLFGRYLGSLDRDARHCLRDALCRRLGNPEGSFALRASVWAVCGRVPPADPPARCKS